MTKMFKKCSTDKKFIRKRNTSYKIGTLDKSEGIITMRILLEVGVFLRKFVIRDHPFKTLACLRGEGCPHVPMVKRSQYIRIENPLHKHFAGMPMVGG